MMPNLKYEKIILILLVAFSPIVWPLFSSCPVAIWGFPASRVITHTLNPSLSPEEMLIHVRSVLSEICALHLFPVFFIEVIQGEVGFASLVSQEWFQHYLLLLLSSSSFFLTSGWAQSSVIKLQRHNQFLLGLWLQVHYKCTFLNFFFFFLSLPFLGPLPAAYGGSQAGGLTGAVAAGLHQRHSNSGSEPRLQPTSQLTATPDP